MARWAWTFRGCFFSSWSSSEMEEKGTGALQHRPEKETGLATGEGTIRQGLAPQLHTAHTGFAARPLTAPGWTGPEVSSL